MAKKKRKNNTTLTAKVKFVKKFATVKPRKKYKRAAAYRAVVTKKYKELKKNRRLKFIKADKKTIKKWAKGGGKHSDKGIFVTMPRSPINDKPFKGVRTTVRKDGVVKQSIKERTEYIFPIDEIEAAALVGDPVAFVDNLKRRYAAIFKKHKKDKIYIRLIFPRGEADEMKIDELEFYLSHLPDIISTRTGKIKKTANRRREEMAKLLTAVKVIFFKRGKGDDDDEIEIEEDYE